MTLRHLQESIEHARTIGVPYLVDDETFWYRPDLHEAKIYTLLEGLCAEIERLQEKDS